MPFKNSLGWRKREYGSDKGFAGKVQDSENSRFSLSSSVKNGLVERGHSPMVNSLAKLCKQRNTENWVQFLSLALWADRISVRRTTGYSAFEMVYGRDCILPVQLSIASWNIIDWEMVKTHEDLILARMLQLDQQTLARDQAAENLINSRKANKAVFDRDR